MKLPPTQFKLIIDSIVWSFKHTTRDIADTGLQICLELLNNISLFPDPNVSNAFYQTYLLSLLGDVFFVLTDSDHKSGFKLQITIVAKIFQMIDSGLVAAPLYDPSILPAQPTMSNAMYLRNYTTNLLHTAFPHLQR